MTRMYKSIGEDMWRRAEKVNGELFVLTYGSIVSQLIADNPGDMEAVNQQLDKMGHGMGIRLADDLFAKTQVQRCGDFQDMLEMVCKVGFRMYMGVSATFSLVGADEAVIQFENVLAELVELDERTRGLLYSQIYCGVIRGALEAVRISVECRMDGSGSQVRIKGVHCRFIGS